MTDNKTALQMLLIDLEGAIAISNGMGNNPADADERRTVYTMLIDEIKSYYIFLEKKQIEAAWNDGYKTSDEEPIFGKYTLQEIKDAFSYYNTTYSNQ